MRLALAMESDGGEPTEKARAKRADGISGLAQPTQVTTVEFSPP
jgi:hypothetical protein